MTATITGIELQRIDADSPLVHEFMSTFGRAVMDPDRVPPERVELRRPVYRTQRVTAATAGGRVVGTFRSWDLDLTVPGPPTDGRITDGRITDGRTTDGGRVPSLRADAISTVSVAPTHRRRGLLTAMMTADLAEAAERGVPVAVLIASEGGIYGRFGFGPATRSATLTVDLHGARFRPDIPVTGSCEIVDETELRTVGPQVYERARTPGCIDRPDPWWDIQLGIVPFPGQEHKHHVGVLHRDDDGTPDGYLRYRPEPDWPDRVTRTVVQVADLVAASPGAYRELWRFLAELDLVATVRAEDRAVDEPLPWLLTDPRAARPGTPCDFAWTRVLDPAAALSTRGYEVPGECVLEVSDPQGWAAGRYRLRAEPDGTGSCERSTDPAEVSLTVQALSALWLGDGDLGGAVLAGQAVEHRPGAARRLSALLRTGRAPWTSTWF